MFDTAQSGTIYTAMGYDTPDTQVKGRTLILSTPQPVSMKNVVLTNDAIPVSSSSAAYILDKASDSSTAIYHINPSQSAVLQQVVVSGQSPAFVSSMVATVTSTQIVLYSLQTGGPKFSVFDLTTKTWISSSGTNPTDGGSLTPGNGGLDAPGSRVPLGVIVGGVVGALVLIALAIFLVIRHRRRRASMLSSSSQSKEEHGESELSSTPNSSSDQNFKKGSITIDAPLLPTVIYPPQPSTVSYPLPPRSSTPRDPQLSSSDTYYPLPSPSSQNSTLRRNPQSPMRQSLLFDFIPKAPPGPELHYSENDDNMTITSSGGYHDANSNNTIVYSTFSDASRDISSPVTTITSRELHSDDYSYKQQQPFTPSSPPVSSSEILYHYHQQQHYTPVGTPQLHHRSQQHIQSPELTYSSPLVSAATHAYSDLSGVTVEVDQAFIVPPSATTSSRPPSSLDN